MKLKLRIFALMAMLLCFAFQANAQVAKIGETAYSTFGEALTAAREMSGDVTVEVYDKVTLNTAFSGSYSSINFVGKDTDAEIYLDVQGYITATGKKVSFKDLTLSKSQGGYITNAGFMNMAFGVYDVVEVAYTNCSFANGAYASSGNVTFTDCEFKRSWDKYGLWAYGDVNVTVDDCVFNDYRGIKMYAEGAAKTTDLTVKNTDFSVVTDKPAIVLTYGESVVLEGNTYSNTGTFELDLDGAPNGVAVTSDVAPVCVNDNGACGVLVDGKIYTTVAQAAEVATEGSNVTLLHSTTDTVEFAEGVNLTLANGVTADNVTVVTPELNDAVASINSTLYPDLASAVAAATAGQTINMLADAAEDVTIPAGVIFNGNGKAVGNIVAAGEITVKGHTKATSFNVKNSGTTINIEAGACLEITGTGRMVIGHGCIFNITGSIVDAKEADIATLTPSLIMPGASFTGAGVDFNVTNAYIKTTASYCSSSKSASGTFDFDITNSIWEQYDKLAFESQSTGATFNFDLVNSVLNTTSHLVFGVSRGEIVIDNSNVNVGTEKQIENQSTMTIKNGSVVNGAVATSSNAKNPGTLIIENATYAVKGEFSGSDLGTGTLIVKNGANFTAGSITKANIQIDATGMKAGDEVAITANLDNFAGTIEVINNSNVEAKIVDGKVVLYEKLVAQIGDTKYTDLHEAMVEAAAGETVILLDDVDLAGIEWEPVAFKGTFDGQNKVIYNLTINKPGVSNTGFITSLNGTFKNVTFTNPTVTGGECTAVVAGRAGGVASLAENITVNGVIKVETTHSGYARTAAIVGGWAYGNYKNITVDGGDKAESYIKHTGGGDGRYVAGIVGHADDVASYVNCTVKNITISGGWLCGAIAGPGPADGLATGCVVENVDMGADYSGGMFGWYYGDGTIENSTIKNVTFTDGSTNNGAIGGYSNNTDANVSNVTIENVKNADGAPLLNHVAKVGDVEYASLQAALNAAAAGTGNVTVTILENVDLTGVTWDPVTVSGPGYPEVTVEGNDKTITGLTDMLFAGTWAGGSGLIIKNLTIENSAIVNDKEDSEGTVGVGAFIGYPQASATITLENCHLKNSSVEGGHWTGGLIGMAGGYNGTDGPVFMNLTIKGCSVTGSTITGKGSAGGVIGHGSCAAWTNVVIEETTVSGNTITSTGSSTNKAGAVMGTIGAAGQATTVNGVTNTGGASVSATVANNDVKSNGTVITTIYGRQGSATGMLYVAGGSYDKYPIEQGVAYAAPIEGYVIAKNADGTYGLDEKVELPEVVITDIKSSLKDSDPDLTFALNFSIKDLENLDEEYIEKVMEQYGSWYTDYVLTISGLTDENVTFNANGNGDGYLAGQYDAWSENWVSVPFEDVTLANGESIYIMEYAAKLMGQSGLRFTLAEIVSIVQNFDCGVYFTPEFLTANPGLEVDLHLKVFTEDAEGNKVNDINVATNNFDVEDYVAIVHADGKQTTYCKTLADAVAAAEADETITLIADVELTETLTIPADKTVALDLNGKTVSMADASGATAALIKNNGNLTITDGTEGKAGKLSFNSTTPSANNGYACNTISNYGTITIEAGTIENTTVGGACYALDNYAGSTATINGGKLTAEKTAVRIFNWTNGDAAKATLNVNGGEIYSKDGYAINVNSGNAPAVALNITGGTITTDDTDYNLAVYVVNKGTAENLTASVTGGTFNGYYALNGITSATMAKGAVSITDGTFEGVICYDEPAYGFITGGTYSNDVNEYCADGYVCEANADGTYGVVNDPGYVSVWTFDDDNNSVDYTNDTDLTVGTLTFKRTFIADIWNPLYLPFDIELTDELLAQFEFAFYNQMHTIDDDGDRIPDDYKMELFTFTSGKLEANYPYFVRPKSADACTMEVVMNNATLYEAEEIELVTNSVLNTFTMSGTHKAMSASDLGASYAVGVDGNWKPSSTGIKAHRLYFTITDRFGNKVNKAIRIVARDENGFEGTTGVEKVETENENDNVVYDLSGRRVENPVKGLYIVNGKKVMF